MEHFVYGVGALSNNFSTELTWNSNPRDKTPLKQAMNSQLLRLLLDPFRLLKWGLAPVYQKVDSAIHWINYYSVDNAYSFRNTFPLGSDLSGR